LTVTDGLNMYPNVVAKPVINALTPSTYRLIMLPTL
jgi:hypothetical protein